MNHTLESYIQAVVDGIYAKYDDNETFKRYVDITKRDIKDIICNFDDEYTLVKKDVIDYYQNDQPVEDAIHYLYPIYDTYCQGSASAM